MLRFCVILTASDGPSVIVLDSLATEKPEVKTQNQDDQDGLSAPRSEERPARPAVLTPIAGQTNIQVYCYST